WPLLRMARAINRAAVAESGFPQNLKRLDASGQMPSVFLGCNGRDIKRPPRDMTAWPFRFVAALARMDKGPARFELRRRPSLVPISSTSNRSNHAGTIESKKLIIGSSRFEAVQSVRISRRGEPVRKPRLAKL